MTKKISKVLFLIHSKALLKYLFLHKKEAPSLNTIDGCNQFAKSVLNYRFDCSNPRTFNEFICWIKVKYRNDLWKQCADKLGVKTFLEENGFGKYVIKTYKVYNSVEEIDLNELPEQFVLKTNHDSGSVFVCDKKSTDFKIVFKKLKQSLNRNYSNKYGEWVYEDIEPRVFAEEIVFPRKGSALVDYKFFSFNGKFGWGFTGQNRTTDTRFCVFEDDFSIQPVEYIYLKPPKNQVPPKPLCFKEMIDVSEKLSLILDFVRVDFYDTDKGPKIGELTFFSQSGFGMFSKKEYDLKYGSFFKRTNLYRNILQKCDKEL